MRTTALHVHGAEEEIFFVLGGSGILYHGDAACEVGAGDCMVHLPEKEAHTLRGGPGGLDVLAFGTRVPVEICHLPRAGMAWAGPTVVSAPGLQNLWAMDAAKEPLVAAPGPRPANVVGLGAVPARTSERKQRSATYRALGRAAGSVRTGLNHVALGPESLGAPAHCHSAEEELFVILDGDGVCTLGSEEFGVRPGHVVSRPPGTGVAHAFRAGPRGLTYLAYGTREPNDIAYYPRSKKVFLRGIQPHRPDRAPRLLGGRGVEAPPRPAHLAGRRGRNRSAPGARRPATASGSTDFGQCPGRRFAQEPPAGLDVPHLRARISDRNADRVAVGETRVRKEDLA